MCNVHLYVSLFLSSEDESTPLHFSLLTSQPYRCHLWRNFFIVYVNTTPLAKGYVHHNCIFFRQPIMVGRGCLGVRLDNSFKYSDTLEYESSWSRVITNYLLSNKFQLYLHWIAHWKNGALRCELFEGQLSIWDKMNDECQTLLKCPNL